MRRALFSVLAPWLCAAALAAQSRVEFRELGSERGGPLAYALVLPPGHEPSRAASVAVLLPDGDGSRASVEAALAAGLADALSNAGRLVVCPLAGEGLLVEQVVARTLRRLRIEQRIAPARVDLVAVGEGVPRAIAALRQQAFEFRSLVAVDGTIEGDGDARLELLRDVALRVVDAEAERLERSRELLRRLQQAGVDAMAIPRDGAVDDAVAAALAELDAAVGEPEDDVAAVDALLDEFHDAAAKADAARYFGCFAPEGVFLGTDPDERWTLAEFREWAKPAFARESAWIFVPRRRQVGIAPSGDFAWFDEVAGNAQFGDCRGTGALRRVGAAWRLVLYDLTVPVPNELLGGVVDLIRGDARRPGVTTVYVLRHAERADDRGDDPPLSAAGERRAQALGELLAEARPAAMFTTGYRRTQATLAPLAAATGIEPEIVPAGEPERLAARIREGRGNAFVVAGHSNTVPAILAALGVTERVTLDEDDYGDLFVVTIDAFGRASLARLHYGAR